MRIFSVVQEVLCRSKTQVFCNEIKSDFFLLVKKNGRLIALQICSLLKATSLQEGDEIAEFSKGLYFGSGFCLGQKKNVYRYEDLI